MVHRILSRVISRTLDREILSLALELVSRALELQSRVLGVINLVKKNAMS